MPGTAKMQEAVICLRFYKEVRVITKTKLSVFRANYILSTKVAKIVMELKEWPKFLSFCN